jgi:ABC-2 type transport system ATP-binding protein
MNAATTFVIHTHGLSKSYNGMEVLQSLDLRVPEKSIFAFLGPNGAGKTTTIKLLLGLIRPTRGGATIFGRDIVQDSVAIRANIGYLRRAAFLRAHDGSDSNTPPGFSSRSRRRWMNA